MRDFCTPLEPGKFNLGLRIVFYLILFPMVGFSFISGHAWQASWENRASNGAILTQQTQGLYLDSLMAKAKAFFDASEHDSTLLYASRFLADPDAEKNADKCVLVCRWISRTYLDQGVYEDALSYAQQSLEWAQRAGNVNAVAYQLADISVIYHEFKDFQKGVEYGKRCLEAATNGKAGSKYRAYCLNAIGINFDDWGKPDSALAYHYKVLALIPRPDSLDIRFTFNNIGNTLMKTQRYDQARPYLLIALQLARRRNDFYDLAGANTNLGFLMSKQRRFAAARPYLDSALYYAIKSNSLEKIRDTYFDLYQFNREQGNLKEAMFFQDRFYQLKDSIFKNERLRAVSELETKYQTSVKDRQILEHQAELKDQQNLFNKTLMLAAFLVVLTGMLIALIALNKSRFEKKKQLLKKELQIQLQEESLRSALSSQELERKRFAQDLHDGMGQLISALRLLVGTLNENTSLDARVQTVGKSEKLIDDMQREIRAIAFNLMPQTLIQHGLVPALKEMALRINASGKRMVGVSSFETSDRFTELQEISIYRIVQEWVNNILKHSAATQINVQLVGHNEELTIMIEDDGAGFDAAILEKSKGNGWKNIQSRAKLIHAAVEIDTAAGRKGCTLILRVPVVESVRERESKIPIATDVH